MAHYHSPDPCMQQHNSGSAWGTASFNPSIAWVSLFPTDPPLNTSHDDGSLSAPAAVSLPGASLPARNSPSNGVGNSTAINIEPEGRRRISRAEWDLHRKTIETLYAQKTLPELRKYMAAHHDFRASIQQWKKTLSIWGLGKNLQPQVTIFMKKKAYSRRVDQNKETSFQLDGRDIPIDKVRRHLGSLEEIDAPLSPAGETPQGLTYSTPPFDKPISEASEQEASADESDSLLGQAARQGREMDKLLAQAQKATTLANGGNYPEAKSLFMESLSGLKSILPPAHYSVLKVLENFIRAAFANQDLDEATSQLFKSYKEHLDVLGPENKKTWQSLARLGLFYKQQGLIGQAYHFLLNARQGLLKATAASPEEAFNHTRWITSELITIAQSQKNFIEAESEAKQQIQQVEDLGYAYERDLVILKHNLVHLYNDDDWQNSNSAVSMIPPPPRATIEDILLSILSTKREIMGFDKAYICSWDHLCRLYSSTGQISKLRLFIPQIEDFIDTLGSLGSLDSGALGKAIDLMKTIADSYATLREWEKAIEWLLKRQEEVVRLSPSGSKGYTALSNIMHIAALHLKQRNTEDARPWLEKAQVIAKSILDPRHRFHSVVATALTEGWLDGSLCLICLVNPNRSAETTGTEEMSLEDLFEKWARERGYVNNVNVGNPRQDLNPDVEEGTASTSSGPAIVTDPDPASD